MSGLYPQALISYEKAIGLERENTRAWYSKCLVLVALNRSQEALACFDQVIALDPQCSVARYGKNLTLQYLKDLNSTGKEDI